MSLKIFYNGTEWRAFEAPEKPDREDYGYIKPKKPINQFEKDMIKYNQALSEAAKNSLPVLNQEVITIDHLEHSRASQDLKIVYYDWPGTYEKKTAYEYIDGTKDEGYVLTLPAPVVEPHIKVKGQGYQINIAKVRNEHDEQIESIRPELSKKDEEIKELREALKEYIEAFMFSNNTYVDWIPTKELIAVYDKAKSLTKP